MLIASAAATATAPTSPSAIPYSARSWPRSSRAIFLQRLSIRRQYSKLRTISGTANRHHAGRATRRHRRVRARLESAFVGELREPVGPASLGRQVEEVP